MKLLGVLVKPFGIYPVNSYEDFTERFMFVNGNIHAIDHFWNQEIQIRE